MHSVQEYCKRLSTEKLIQLLREDVQGIHVLPEEIVLLIYEILASRSPFHPDREEVLQLFREHYQQN